MNIERKAYITAAGLMAACMAAAPASAQDFIEYQYGASPGAVRSVSVANLKPNGVVTGVGNSAGNLELIVWKSNGTELLRKGSATDTAFRDIGSAPVSTLAMNGKSVITAVAVSGEVELILWSVSSSGAVTPVMAPDPWTFAGYGTSARLAKIDSTHFLLAVVNNQGILYVSSWETEGGGVQVLDQLSVATGAVGTYAAVAAVSPAEFVTALRTSAGDLQLDSWQVGENYRISHQAMNSAGGISQVDMAVWGAEAYLATVVINSLGDLEVIDWSVDPGDGTIARESSENLGSVGQVAASPIGYELFTASVNSSGHVDAGVWNNNGTQITQGASTQEEAATLVSAAPLSAGYSTVTASRTAAGNLQVDVWSGDYVAP